MRIADLTAIFPCGEADAEGRSVASLDRALVRAGVGVTTLVLKPWVPLALARRLPAYRHLAVRTGIRDDRGIRVVVCRYPHLPVVPLRSRGRLNLWSMARHARRRLQREGAEVDLIHAQGTTMGQVAHRLSVELGLPFAVTLRDDLRHLEPRLAAAEEALYRPVFEQAVAIFAIGPRQMRDLPRLFGEALASKLRLAPNGVEVEEIEEKLQTFRRRPASPVTRVVSVGNLYRWKGIHEVLHALRLLLDEGQENWRYTAVGDGPYRDELEGLADRLGVSERVSFTGKLRHQDALRQIFEADIFCLPSWMESFGNVYGEAAVCGVPAVGCRDGGAELIIRDGETGLLVPPRDAEAVAGALADLMRDPGRARRMGEAAKVRIRELTWDRTAAIYGQALRAAGRERVSESRL